MEASTNVANLSTLFTYRLFAVQDITSMLILQLLSMKVASCHELCIHSSPFAAAAQIAYYFKTMVNSHPIYGADTEGSFYDENVPEFKMKRLGTILDETKELNGGKEIRGVTTVYLYFGMYGASFA
ncbi:unnamed protein product [Cylicocyclus nassatus]|uniref:Uncharacterized protein n=1 Tax=Cylicocyclus nassatus TaxID=53992 RepID=A0AA36GQB7_CYLNA|nr:unnamed protein product [Cylicocyclus nassatus]